MLRIIPKIFIIIFSSLLFSKEYLAVIDFSANNVPNGDVNALTQRLITEMINLGEYQVIERSEMKKILDEQRFQHSGCVTAQCAVDIGKLLGAKFMVVGSISKVGSAYAVDARIIDVETGEANKSASYQSGGKIEELLSIGMSEISQQLSIDGYTTSLNKIYVDKKRQNKKVVKFNNAIYKTIHKSFPFDYFSFSSMSFPFGSDISLSEKIEMNCLTFRRKSNQAKVRLILLDSNSNDYDAGYDKVHYYLYFGVFKNIKKNKYSSLSTNIWFSLNPSTDLGDFGLETNFQFETSKFFQFGLRATVGLRLDFNETVTSHNVEFDYLVSGLYSSIDLIFLSFGDNY